jgi:hypothetical protein
MELGTAQLERQLSEQTNSVNTHTHSAQFVKKKVGKHTCTQLTKIQDAHLMFVCT